MVRFRIAAGVALALTALPAAAQFTNALFEPQLPVNALAGSSFEVIEKYGAGPRQIWCAAASYAIDQQGAQRGRLYIVTPRGPAQTVSGAKGVAFSTRDPGNAPAPGYSVTTDVVGANLLLFHAVQFCKDEIIDPSDLSP